jgi:hypothetical protein
MEPPFDVGIPQRQIRFQFELFLVKWSKRGHDNVVETPGKRSLRSRQYQTSGREPGGMEIWDITVLRLLNDEYNGDNEVSRRFFVSRTHTHSSQPDLAHHLTISLPPFHRGTLSSSSPLTAYPRSYPLQQPLALLRSLKRPPQATPSNQWKSFYLHIVQTYLNRQHYLMIKIKM